MDAVRIHLADEEDSVLAGAFGGREGAGGFLEKLFLRRGVPGVRCQAAAGQASDTGRTQGRDCCKRSAALNRSSTAGTPPGCREPATRGPSGSQNKTADSSRP